MYIPLFTVFYTSQVVIAGFLPSTATGFQPSPSVSWFQWRFFLLMVFVTTVPSQKNMDALTEWCYRLVVSTISKIPYFTWIEAFVSSPIKTPFFGGSALKIHDENPWGVLGWWNQKHWHVKWRWSDNSWRPIVNASLLMSIHVTVIFVDSCYRQIYKNANYP